jgi:hypothetical protein
MISRYCMLPSSQNSRAASRTADGSRTKGAIEVPRTDTAWLATAASSQLPLRPFSTPALEVRTSITAKNAYVMTTHSTAASAVRARANETAPASRTH